ncbi:MAG: ankyrin repeat domain-containing protein [Capsulimonadaceae bacterium]
MTEDENVGTTEELAAAVTAGRWDDAGRMVAAGVDLNGTLPGSGDTVLHRAVEARNPAFVRQLLHLGADSNQPSRGGDTPLMTACRGDLAVEAQLLLDYGADPSFWHNGWTPLRYAAKDRNATIIQLLLRAGAVIPEPDPRESWAAALDAYAREIAATNH